MTRLEFNVIQAAMRWFRGGEPYIFGGTAEDVAAACHALDQSGGGAGPCCDDPADLQPIILTGPKPHVWTSKYLSKPKPDVWHEFVKWDAKSIIINAQEPT